MNLIQSCIPAIICHLIPPASFSTDQTWLAPSLDHKYVPYGKHHAAVSTCVWSIEPHHDSGQYVRKLLQNVECVLFNNDNEFVIITMIYNNNDNFDLLLLLLLQNRYCIQDYKSSLHCIILQRCYCKSLCIICN